MKRTKPFWIKTRHNPQLGTYHEGMGRLSKTKAKQYENTLYGCNEMISFDDQASYEKELQRLRENGEKVY